MIKWGELKSIWQLMCLYVKFFGTFHDTVDARSSQKSKLR